MTSKFQRIDELQHQIMQARAAGEDCRPQFNEQERLVDNLFRGWFSNEGIEHGFRDALEEELFNGMTQPTESWIRYQIESLSKVIEEGRKDAST